MRDGRTMPKIPAEAFGRLVDEDGTELVTILCANCGETAYISPESIQLPLCVHNGESCPLLNLGVKALQDLGGNVLYTGSTGPTTTGLI